MPASPQIRTERLILRALEPADAPRLVELMRDKSIAWNTATIPYPFRREDADAFLARRAGRTRTAPTFAIALDGELVGVIGLVRTATFGEDVWGVGYWIGADYRGAGLMTEALIAVAAFARDELGAAAIVAGHPASAAVLKKAGFAPTGEKTMTKSVGRGCEVETMNYRIEFKRPL